MKNEKTINVFEILNKTIRDFGFSAMVIINCNKLEINNIYSLLENIDSMDNKDSLYIREFGEKSRAEIKSKLFEVGIDIENFNLKISYKPIFSEFIFAN